MAADRLRRIRLLFVLDVAMSLINQMLRDLEQRNGKPIPADQPLPIRVARHQPPAARNYRPLALLLIAAIAPAYFWFRQDADPTVAPPQTNSQPTAPQSAPSTTEPLQAMPTPDASDEVKTTTQAPAPPATDQALAPPPPLDNPAAPALGVTVKATASPARPKPAKPVANPSTAKPTATQQAQALYRAAQDSSSLLMRRENLDEALTLDPDYLPARILMLQTLVKANATTELDRFLDDSLRRYPSQLAFVTARAQLQMRRRDFATAAATLERIDPHQVEDPTYLAQLAASYQQLRRFENAAELYQRLTTIQPEKTEHWLGLAVSADSLQHRQTAIQAYRRALEKNNLTGDVVDYINQRLRALN